MIPSELIESVKAEIGDPRGRSRADRARVIAQNIAKYTVSGELVSIRDVCFKLDVTFKTAQAACAILQDEGFLALIGCRFFRTRRPFDEARLNTIGAPEARVFTRPTGQSFTWYPVGTVLHREGRKVAVLHASERVGRQCEGCIFSKAPFEACVAARRDSFGDCISWCRGDSTRVIFHEIGTQVPADCRRVNKDAGLEKLF